MSLIDENVPLQSFAEKLKENLPAMRAYARSLVRDVTLADDIVQDACLKAWDRQDSFDSNRALKPWLFTIVRNEYLQRRRRDWRWNTLSPEQESSIPDKAISDIEKLQRRQMRLAMATLSEEQRDALILVLAAGFSYIEAAEIANCTAGTMKSRVSRAREHVRTQLEHGLQSTNDPEQREKLAHMLGEMLAGRIALPQVDQQERARKQS